MKRGEIWTVSGGADYAGKPRPVLVLQDDSFDGTASITICGFTSDETEAPLFRLPILPDARNGLVTASRLMIDKVTTVPKAKVGKRLGQLASNEMQRVDRALIVFLGLAGAPRRSA